MNDGKELYIFKNNQPKESIFKPYMGSSIPSKIPAPFFFMFDFKNVTFTNSCEIA